MYKSPMVLDQNVQLPLGNHGAGFLKECFI
jgi:hypothetical protein